MKSSEKVPTDYNTPIDEGNALQSQWAVQYNTNGFTRKLSHALCMQTGFFFLPMGDGYHIRFRNSSPPESPGPIRGVRGGCDWVKRTEMFPGPQGRSSASTAGYPERLPPGKLLALRNQWARCSRGKGRNDG